MWSGPIRMRFHSGSSGAVGCSSTSMTGTAVIAAPGPSRSDPSHLVVLTPSRFSFWLILTPSSQGFRDAESADDPEVDVHQQDEQPRQQEHVDRKEPLQGGWPHRRSPEEDGLEQPADDG